MEASEPHDHGPKCIQGQARPPDADPSMEPTAKPSARQTYPVTSGENRAQSLGEDADPKSGPHCKAPDLTQGSLESLVDAEWVDSSLILTPAQIFGKNHPTEPKRFSAARKDDSPDRQSFHFESAPKHTSNHFSGTQAAHKLHAKPKSPTRQPHESVETPQKAVKISSQWRGPERSSSTTVEAPAVEGHSTKMLSGSGTKRQAGPLAGSPQERVERVNNQARMPYIQAAAATAAQSKQDVRIGDLALPGENKPQHRPRDVNALSPRQTQSVEVESGFISESAQLQPASNARHRHGPRTTRLSYDERVDMGPELSTRPGSRVSNVSRMRNTRSHADELEILDVPTQQMVDNLQFIYGERLKLREKLASLKRAYQKQEEGLAEAGNRISVGKDQLKDTMKQLDQVKKINDNLVGDRDNLLQQIEVLGSQVAAAKKIEQQAVNNLQATQTRLALLQGGMKERYNMFRDHLNKAVQEHQNLAAQSKQRCDDVIKYCRDIGQKSQQRENDLLQKLDASRKTLETTQQEHEKQQMKAAEELAELSGQMSQIEQRLSDSRDENIGLLRILDNQDAQTTALEGLESRLNASLADLQALFTTTTASKPPSESDDKLKEILVTLQASNDRSRVDQKATQTLGSELKKALCSLATETRESSAAQKSLETDIKNIEQILQSEINIMRQTHSAREAEMRQELMAVVEGKAKIEAELDTQRNETQSLVYVQNAESELVEELTANLTNMEATLLATEQNAATSTEKLHSACQEKDEQITVLRSTMQEASDKHHAECEVLKKRLAEAVARAQDMSSTDEGNLQLRRQLNLESQLGELKGCQDETTRPLESAKDNLALLQTASAATEADSREQLDSAEKKIRSLTRRLEKESQASKPVSARAVNRSLENIDQMMQKLGTMQTHLHRLSGETVQVKEMDRLLRMLLEFQGVLSATRKTCSDETVMTEKLQLEVQSTNNCEKAGAATVKLLGYAASSAEKQVMLRTPSQHGEMPGVEALAPAMERVNRRMKRPKKPNLRSRTIEIGDSQASHEEAQEAKCRVIRRAVSPDPTAVCQSGHRTFSKPVEGKPQRANVHKVQQGAVQRLMTTLVGEPVSNSDELTSLASWKSSSQRSIPSTEAQQRMGGGQGTKLKRTRSSTGVGTGKGRPGTEVSEPFMKKLRSFCKPSQRDISDGLPPSNQQA